MNKLIISIILNGIYTVAASNFSNPSTTEQNNLVVNQVPINHAIFFKDLPNPLISNYNKDEMRKVVRHAKENPYLIIQLFYADKSSNAKNIAAILRKNIKNKIVIDDCCKVDRGHYQLKSGEVVVMFYKPN